MTDASPFTHTDLSSGTTYFYAMTSSNTHGSSGLSNEVSATPTSRLSAPSVPTGLIATPGDTDIDLAWGAVTEATSYNVYGGTISPVVPSTSTLVSSGVIATRYLNTKLANGTTYYYVVTAENSAGESPASSEVGVMPATYFVDGRSGNDANPGSFAAPFKTITFALITATNGQVIKVLPATYNATLGEIFPLQAVVGVHLIGNEMNPGTGPTAVVIDGMGPVGTTTSSATLMGWDGGRITGFVIGDSASTNRYWGIYAAGVSMTISANTFNSPTYGGIRLVRAGNAIVEDNDFDTRSYGVYVQDCPNAPRVQNNIFRNMGLPIDVTGSATNVIIDSNTIIGNGQVGIQVQNGVPQILNNDFQLKTGYTYGAISTGRANAMPIVRGNKFRCTTAVLIRDGMPDLGTARSPGNNNFSAVSGVSITHESSATINAYGNTFPNNPPILGQDIVITGGGRVLY